MSANWFKQKGFLSSLSIVTAASLGVLLILAPQAPRAMDLRATDRPGVRGAERYDADGVLDLKRDLDARPARPQTYPIATDLDQLSLTELLVKAVESHDSLQEQRAVVEEAREEAREAMEDWFPQLDLDYTYGWEGQKKPDAIDTSLPFHEVGVEITQLLWDFGTTNAAVEQKRLALVAEQIELVGERQDLLKDSIEAYANLVVAHKLLAFARHSEENIRRQSDLQEELGIDSGLATDQLQARRDYAGAIAERYDAEVDLEEAKSAFKRFFSFLPEQVDDLKPLAEPIKRMPGSLEEAISAAHRKNPSLRIAALEEAEARQALREEQRDLLPKVEASVGRDYTENSGGTSGPKHTTFAQVNINLPFNLGLTAVNTLRAKQAALVAETRNILNETREIEEDVHDAWANWETARKKWRIREKQAEIAAAFLRLARTEQAEGNRSLQDVLSGETRLLDAQSEAAEAQGDVVIEAFTLLAEMGELYYDVLEDFDVVPVATGANPRAIIAPEVELLGSFGESVFTGPIGDEPSSTDTGSDPASSPNGELLEPLAPFGDDGLLSPTFEEDSLQDGEATSATFGAIDPVIAAPAPEAAPTPDVQTSEPLEPLVPLGADPATDAQVAPQTTPEARMTRPDSPEPQQPPVPETGSIRTETERLQDLIRSVPVPAR